MGNGSDMHHAADGSGRLFEEGLGEHVVGPARKYKPIRREARLKIPIASRPEVF